MLNRSVFGLPFHFIREQGTPYLIIYKSPAFQQHDFTDLEYKMLQINEIPGLLKLEFEQHNSEIQLRYHPSSFKMLEHYIHIHNLTLDEMFKLLVQIIRHLQQLSAYYLDVQRVVLQKEFIFIAHAIDEVYLTYLPAKQLKRDHSLLEELNGLIMFLIQFVDELHGNRIQKLLKIITYAMEEGYESPDWDQMLVVLEEAIGTSQGDAPQIDVSCDNTGHKTVADELSDGWKKRLTRLKQTIGWHGIAAALFKKRLAEIDAAEDSKYVANQNNLEVNWEQYYLDLADKTTLLAPSHEKTQLLTTNIESKLSRNIQDHPEPTAYLHTKTDEASEALQISGNRFIIGRGPSEVDYAVNYPMGVSRVHAEILKYGEDYVIQDLGSKNGSIVNEKALPPYEPLSLKHGDIIRLVQNEFMFEKTPDK